MTLNKLSQKSKEIKNYLDPKIGLVFSAVIILQYIFSPFISLLGLSYKDFLYIDTISAYLMVLISLRFFNNNSLEIFKDHFTLFIIVLSCFFPLIFGNNDSILYKGALGIVGLSLALYTIVNRKKIKIPDWRSFLRIIFLTCSGLIIIAFVYALSIQTYTKPFPDNFFNILFSTFINQLTFVAVVEEIRFRGLIFSFLVMNGYKEDKAFAIQGLLFWGIHFTYLFTDAPLRFFVIIPLSTLFVTLIARKYKMLYSPIILHTAINVLTSIIASILNNYIL